MNSTQQETAKDMAKEYIVHPESHQHSTPTPTSALSQASVPNLLLTIIPNSIPITDSVSTPNNGNVQTVQLRHGPRLVNSNFNAIDYNAESVKNICSEVTERPAQFLNQLCDVFDLDKDKARRNFRFYCKNDVLFEEVDAFLTKTDLSGNYLFMPLECLKKESIMKKQNFKQFIQTFNIRLIENWSQNAQTLFLDFKLLPAAKPASVNEEMYSFVDYVLKFKGHKTDLTHVEKRFQLYAGKRNLLLEGAIMLLKELNENGPHQFRWVVVPILDSRPNFQSAYRRINESKNQKAAPFKKMFHEEVVVAGKFLSAYKTESARFNPIKKKQPVRSNQQQPIRSNQQQQSIRSNQQQPIRSNQQQQPIRSNQQQHIRAYQQQPFRLNQQQPARTNQQSQMSGNTNQQ